MSKSITVYGIPNCDTVKKARAWLEERGVGYRFHDFKKEGLPADRAGSWVASLGWESLVNRKGTTWRKLDSAARDGVTDPASALALMHQQPSVVKRPVVEWGPETTAGFDPQRWEALIGR